MSVPHFRPGQARRRDHEHRHQLHLENLASDGGIYGYAWGHPDNERAMRLAHPELFAPSVPQPKVKRIRPASSADRSQNPLRPHSLDDVIGQPMAKRTLRRVIDKTVARHEPLPHTLLVGAAGTGKTTFANVIAHELGVDVYAVAAPVSFDTLLELRESMLAHDILLVDEIHLQSWGDRRGRGSDTSPEQFFHIMEDRVMLTPTGPLPFPKITVIGATTDEGQLPDAFLRRFPLRPHLEPYTQADMVRVAQMNADKLSVSITTAAAAMFGRASRLLPWQVNTFMQSAVLFAPADRVTVAVAREVLRSMFVTEDGLTADMQAMLKFLYTRGRQQLSDGTVRYQYGIAGITTALGKSRDTKAINLRVEPYLIERGFVQVVPQGRRLTDAGIKRAQELLR